MIYVLEDDTDIREIELYTLRSLGIAAEGFAKASEFLTALRRTKPDLILLDVMLPDADGFKLLGKLRGTEETNDIPIILATARGAEFEKVKALNAGADDYLVKPFSMLEMAARIKAVLRRTERKEDSSIVTLGPLSIDESKHEVTLNGASLALSKKEFDLLSVLVERPGHVFSREALLERVWGANCEVTTHTVDVHIATLRTKLGDFAEKIRTVHGVGYKVQS